MLITEQLCRACKEELTTIFNLGTLALSAFPTTDIALPKAPLDFCRCQGCGLVQLRHTVSPDIMFKHYWYRSGVNETMRSELEDIVAHSITTIGGLTEGEVVVDIGANDGTLLSFYPKAVKRIAYEPANNLLVPLSEHCTTLIPEYFPNGTRLEPKSVSIFTSIACFYAVNDPVGFVSAVDAALAIYGVWVVQFQDLHQMLQTTAFDDICHEHLFYPSLASMERVIAPFDLAVIDAQYREINGGSLRVTIGRKWRQTSSRVEEIRRQEEGCESVATLRRFARNVGRVREEIKEAVKSERVIDLYGASTKGNTLLQYCELGPNAIRQAWERSPEKWGRRTVTGIPIVSEAEGRSDLPDMLFVGIWQFRKAILQREASYLRSGGKLLFPLPTVEIISHAAAA